MNPSALSAAEALSPQALTTVVARLGMDVAAPLTAALDRLQNIADSGRLDRAGLEDLRADIDKARRAGLLGQQIARLCAGQAHLVPERLNLATLLRQVLDDQAAEVANRPVCPTVEHLDEVMVLADPSLLATLLRGAAGWSAAHALAPVVWRLSMPPAAGHAVLSCQVPMAQQPAPSAPAAPSVEGGQPAQVLSPTAAHVSPGLGSPGEQPMVAGDGPRHLAALDSLNWLLMLCAAHLADVQVEREDQPAVSLLRLQLPHCSAADVVDAREGAQAGGRLMAGSQMLVLGSGRDARQRVREAMNGHDVFIDSVSSVAAASGYCDEGAPQVLIFESAFISDALRHLCERLAWLQPSVVLVELLPAGQDVAAGVIGLANSTQLGLDALRQNLAPALARALSGTR